MESQDLLNSLTQHFGFTEFRVGQAETITQLISGHSSLAIFPTGSGKSLCYQLTALHLPHLTLVVSPLVALMKDQIAFLKSKNIAAESLDAGLSPQAYQDILKQVKTGNSKILMVSVERFKNERFRQFIEQVPISLIVIDEAHCISEWGHNFRPDYLKLPEYKQQLNIPQALLLTATATKTVKRDMATKFAIQPEHINQTGFYRSNLQLSIEPTSEQDKQQRLKDCIGKGAGIVYVTLQQSAETLASYLTNQGIQAAAYHAGLDSELRTQVQQQFMRDKLQVVVATIAFGMGVDKSNIRFVIHYDLPKSIENYSQEIGRAGRDGMPANCITLANLDGVPTLENFVYGDTPPQEGIATLIEFLLANAQGDKIELQLHQLSSLCNIRPLPLKTLLVQLELRGAIKPLYAYFAEFKIKPLSTVTDITAQFDGERAQFIDDIFTHTQFKKVWGTLDMNTLLAKGHQRQRVVTALEYLQEKALIELQTSKMTDVYQADHTQLSAPELTDILHQYFVDKEQKEIKRIASLVRFFELDKCLTSNLARYFDDQNAPEQCGHCSVCLGKVAKLQYSNTPKWPSDEQLRHYLNGLAAHAEAKLGQPLSNASCIRFLAGISTPVFTRLRARQLPGFASCEQLRYHDIELKVAHLR
ncbi:RecQ family ATP-dependent DNA helicase [Salinibius halmophilus]|uniref:RecQ family ATP-dependent DNA helicase n=1 Tax=Salinibius halmophilus TaxID=1853216 RepID=UPI000E66F86D|nr:RecQ family ATP-dependent DNA helicase [Salinibius halmophilus]